MCFTLIPFPYLLELPKSWLKSELAINPFMTGAVII